jgi:predicted Zn-dependent protease
VTYSNLLTEEQRWKELIHVALLVRHEDNPLRDALASYSYYIEGLGELGQGRRPVAVEIFKRIPATKVKNSVWDLIIAEKLERLGFPEIAKDTLMGVQQDAAGNLGFWVLLAKTAFDIQDPDLLVSAMASAYKLQPDDPMIVNNYAAALISTRQHPDEALKLTARAVDQFPHDPGRLINHALALLQNQQLADAESMLGKIDSTKLTGADLTSYHYAWFELHFTLRRYDQAREASSRIQPQYLLPTEKKWLESARQKMPPSEPGEKSKPLDSPTDRRGLSPPHAASGPNAANG